MRGTYSRSTCFERTWCYTRTNSPKQPNTGQKINDNLEHHHIAEGRRKRVDLSSLTQRILMTPKHFVWANTQLLSHTPSNTWHRWRNYLAMYRVILNSVITVPRIEWHLDRLWTSTVYLSAKVSEGREAVALANALSSTSGQTFCVVKGKLCGMRLFPGVHY